MYDPLLRPSDKLVKVFLDDLAVVPREDLPTHFGIVRKLQSMEDRGTVFKALKLGRPSVCGFGVLADWDVWEQQDGHCRYGTAVCARPEMAMNVLALEKKMFTYSSFNGETLKSFKTVVYLFWKKK